MSWPTDSLVTTHTDADGDSPLSARPVINSTIQAVKDIIASRGAASGVAELDSSGYLPDARINPSSIPSQWQTGDIRFTARTTPASGWIALHSGGTIGNGSSNATNRANADCADLFALLWDDYSNSVLPVYDSSGSPVTRGASAAADFAANRQIALPDVAGRALAAMGSGSGLTSRLALDETGAETHTLSVDEIPAHRHNEAKTNSATGASATTMAAGNGTANQVNNTHMSEAGGGQAHNNMQPTVFFPTEMKL